MTMKSGRKRQVSVTDSVIVYHVPDTIVKGLATQKGKEREFLLPWSVDPSGRDKCMSR